MDRKKERLLKVMKFFGGALAVIGLVAVVLFPLDNRNLKLKVNTDKGVFEFVETNSDIANGIRGEYIFENANSVQVMGIEIYGRYETICLKKMDVYSIATMVGSVANGTMELQESSVNFSTSDDHVIVSTNESFNKMLYELSSTAILERFIMGGIYLILLAVGIFMYKLIKEVFFIKDENMHGIVYEIKKFGSDIVDYGQYMVYAAKTDLQAEVANSYLNRLWWLLEPFFNMIVYVVVFGRVMGNSVENYATFIFSALLMWNFFSKTINYSVKLVRNNRDIISKVYVPKFILLISNMILNMFKLLFSLIVLVAMLFIFKIEIGFNIIWVIPAYVMMILLAFGAGMIFLHFGVYVDDLSYAVGILLNMLMFLSGIFYEVMVTLPEPLNVLMMCMNPVAVFVDTMRNALLYNTITNLPLVVIWTVLAFVLCCIGVHVVYKNENSYVKVV